jgi:hypothetical protein
MKMLMIVFRQSNVEQIHALLKENEVPFFLSPGTNCIILTAVSEQAAYRLIDGFTRLREEHKMREHDNASPLHVFVLPCEQAV